MTVAISRVNHMLEKLSASEVLCISMRCWGTWQKSVSIWWAGNESGLRVDDWEKVVEVWKQNSDTRFIFIWKSDEIDKGKNVAWRNGVSACP